MWRLAQKWLDGWLTFGDTRFVQVSTVHVKDIVVTMVSLYLLKDPRTQGDIAEEAGISQSYLSAIKLGNRPLTVEAVPGIAVALDIPYRKLVEDLTPDEISAIELALPAHRARVAEIRKRRADEATRKQSHRSHEPRSGQKAR